MDTKLSSHLNTIPGGRIFSQDSRPGSQTGMMKKQESRFTRINNSKLRPQTALGGVEFESHLSIGSTVSQSKHAPGRDKRGSAIVQAA